MSSAMQSYATDEDVAVAAPADFLLICPRDQVLAAGQDGSFLGAEPWTLRSATIDFAGTGAGPGGVVVLLGPSSAFAAPGEVLGIAAAGAGTVELRRKGLAAGRGRPPGPAAGLSGVEFLVPTLEPQLAAAAGELGWRFGLAAGATPEELDEAAGLADLRAAAVLTVLRGRYADLGGDPGGTFTAKLEWVRSELGAVLGRIAARRAAGAGGIATRLGR